MPFSLSLCAFMCVCVCVDLHLQPKRTNQILPNSSFISCVFRRRRRLSLFVRLLSALLDEFLTYFLFSSLCSSFGQFSMLLQLRRQPTRLNEMKNNTHTHNFDFGVLCELFFGMIYRYSNDRFLHQNKFQRHVIRFYACVKKHFIDVVFDLNTLNWRGNFNALIHHRMAIYLFAR